MDLVKHIKHKDETSFAYQKLTTAVIIDGFLLPFSILSDCMSDLKLMCCDSKTVSGLQLCLFVVLGQLYQSQRFKPHFDCLKVRL